ncbi:hypothetical protein FHS59_003889 [Algoriphagus iocasae]|uniref:DUF3108 domain-containing protein n=1 Tax=Algoriphagus iocasae TaxID=1836499 RepID=A0A841MW16_9BACT|nr:hypothetical protein [Algoriphagus iocasae]MBB6328246.1 hypothetical protein [Algoriphagus iocasae]
MNCKIMIILACALLACGRPEEVATTVQSEKVSDAPELESPVPGSIPCGDIPFFQPGTEIISKDFNKTGQETSAQTIRVLNVRQENGFSVAEVEGTGRSLPTGAETQVKFSYRCDGNNLYFDMASMYRTQAKAKDSTFQSEEFILPLQLKVGENLPDIVSTVRSEQGGKPRSMTITLSNRKVTAQESVTTEAGTWDAFKITNDLKIDMELPGMDANMKEMIAKMQAETKLSSITWFAPAIGIVKSETYKNGELESGNRIVGIRNLRH